MFNDHQFLFEAGDEVRDAIGQKFNLNEVPDDVFDIEAIVEEVYEDDGEVLSPLVKSEESFWIIVENHRYKATA